MALITPLSLSENFGDWIDRTNDIITAVNNVTDDNGNLSVDDGDHIYLEGSGGTITIGGEATGTATITDLTNISVNIQLDTEAVMDRAQSMISNGIHSGISATYDDNGNRLNLALVADPVIALTGPITGSVEITNLASGTYGLATSITDNSITQSKLADDAVGSAELKDVVSLQILNAAGTALKTLYGAGS